GVLVGGRHVNDEMLIFPAGLEQALHSRNDLVIDLVAGERVARPGPGIREVDADERRPAAEADASLKSAFLIDLGAFLESLLEHVVELIEVHRFLRVPAPLHSDRPSDYQLAP